MADDLNGLDHRINDRGFFERLLSERDRTEAERDKRLDERFEAQKEGLAVALAAAKEAVTVALVEREKSVTAALTAAEKAVDKAEQAQLRVNVTQNEFRATLKDQAADLMPRAETELLVRDLRDQIEQLRGSRREGTNASTDLLARFLPILIAIIALYFATH
jgi:hypothetical protein